MPHLPTACLVRPGAWRPVFVLVEPRESGNVGMVARAMANFGVSRLVLANCPGRPDETDLVTARAEGRKILGEAIHAKDLSEALEPCEVAIGVTRRVGKHRTPDLTPFDLGNFLDTLPPESAIAFVFGREADGLRIDEIARCGRLLSIPTAAEAPSLNLAQAATITAFMLFAAGGTSGGKPEAPPDTPDRLARGADLEPLFTDLEAALSAIGFLQGDRAGDSLLTLRRLIGRALPTAREARLLRSLARKIGRKGSGTS